MTSSAPALSRSAILVILFTATAMASLGASIYIPSIPDIARYFAVPVGDVQLTVTTYAVGFAAGTLVSGPMCDRFGRRRALLVAATLCFLGSAVSAAAPGLGVLYVGRVAQAFGAATATVATRAVVRDLFDRVGTARALSLLALAATVTPILAPIIGGFLQVAFGWRAGLMMVTVIAAAVGVLLWRVLPETNVELQNEVGLIRGVVRGYVRLLRIPRFIGYGLANMNPGVCLFAFLTAMPVILIDLGGLSPARFGFYAGLLPLGYMAAALINTRLVRHIDPDRIMVAGGATVLMGGLALAWFGDAAVPLSLVAPCLLTGFGNGLVASNGNAGAVSLVPQLAGAASGFIGFCHMSGAALATGALSLITISSVTPLAVVFSLAGTMALIGMTIGRFGSPTAPPEEA